MISARSGASAALLLAVSLSPGLAQAPAPAVPLVSGLVLGSVLHSPLGEREDVIEIKSADQEGVHYLWHERTIQANGDTVEGSRKRFVSAGDLAGAPRFDDVFAPTSRNAQGSPRSRFRRRCTGSSSMLAAPRSA